MGSTQSSSAATKKIECPFAIKWEIKEEKLAALKNSKNGNFQTKWFNAANIPGVQYQLEIYPNGNKEENRGKVFIFLNLNVGNEKKIKANFKLVIEPSDFIYKFNYKFKETCGYGERLFLTTNDLFHPKKKYIVNGKLIIKCHGTLNVEREVIDVTNKWDEQNFLGKLWNKDDKDFTIVVDGQSIRAHKNILSLRSPVFKTMFNSGMKEAVENKMEITDFTYETVEAAIELMYDRKISTLNLEEKIDVLLFFDKYDIQDFKDLLETTLAEDISPASVVSITNYSIAMNHVKFQERCTNFMVACMKMDRPIKDFDDLNETFALKILKKAFYNNVKS